MSKTDKKGKADKMSKTDKKGNTDKMSKTDKKEVAGLCKARLVHMFDETGEEYLYDQIMSESLSPDTEYNVGSASTHSFIDSRCLYRRQPDGTYRRMSDGLVVKFMGSRPKPKPSVFALRDLLGGDPEDFNMTEEEYCAKYGLVDVISNDNCDYCFDDEFENEREEKVKKVSEEELLRELTDNGTSKNYLT